MNIPRLLPSRSNMLYFLGCIFIFLAKIYMDESSLSCFVFFTCRGHSHCTVYCRAETLSLLYIHLPNIFSMNHLVCQKQQIIHITHFPELKEQIKLEVCSLTEPDRDSRSDIRVKVGRRLPNCSPVSSIYFQQPMFLQTTDAQVDICGKLGVSSSHYMLYMLTHWEVALLETMRLPNGQLEFESHNWTLRDISSHSCGM